MFQKNFNSISLKFEYAFRFIRNNFSAWSSSKIPKKNSKPFCFTVLDTWSINIHYLIFFWKRTKFCLKHGNWKFRQQSITLVVKNYELDKNKFLWNFEIAKCFEFKIYFCFHIFQGSLNNNSSFKASMFSENSKCKPA